MDSDPNKEKELKLSKDFFTRINNLPKTSLENPKDVKNINYYPKDRFWKNKDGKIILLE